MKKKTRERKSQANEKKLTEEKADSRKRNYQNVFLLAIIVFAVGK